MRTLARWARYASSRYLSNVKSASSTVLPRRLISGETEVTFLVFILLASDLPLLMPFLTGTTGASLMITRSDMLTFDFMIPHCTKTLPLSSGSELMIPLSPILTILTSMPSIISEGLSTLPPFLSVLIDMEEEFSFCLFLTLSLAFSSSLISLSIPAFLKVLMVSSATSLASLRISAASSLAFLIISSRLSSILSLFFSRAS